MAALRLPGLLLGLSVVAAVTLTGEGFDIIIPKEEFIRITGLNVSLPFGGRLVRDGVVDGQLRNTLAPIFRDHTVDGSFNWVYNVTNGESVSVAVLASSSASADEVRLLARNYTALPAGVTDGSLVIECLRRRQLEIRVQLSIHYDMASGSGTDQQLDLVVGQDCSNFVPTTPPRPTTASRPPTTTAAVHATTTAAVHATTTAAVHATTPVVTVQETEPQSSDGGLETPVLVGIIIGLAAVILFLVFVAVKLEMYGRKHWRSRRKSSPPKQSMFDDVLIDYDELHLGRELGKGAFGVVREGTLQNERVAVKIIKDPGNDDRVVKFLEEAMYMKGFHHPNVLSLRGVCFQPNEAPMIVVPFMSNGDLHTYLNEHNTTVTPTCTPLDYQQLLNFSIQATNAMEYLASLNFVHRDLAARNCLLTDDLVLRVADFGLARDMQDDLYYRMNSELRMPVKWTALESIQHQKFTLESDVWAYGVLLWEIMSTGMLPYPGIPNAELVPYLENGQRLAQPSRCPDSVYVVMLACWETDPAKRPHFSQIKRMLRESNNQLYENIMAMPIYRDVPTLERNAISSSQFIERSVSSFAMTPGGAGQTSTSASSQPRSSVHEYSNGVNPTVTPNPPPSSSSDPAVIGSLPPHYERPLEKRVDPLSIATCSKAQGAAAEAVALPDDPRYVPIQVVEAAAAAERGKKSEPSSQSPGPERVALPPQQSGGAMPTEGSEL